MIMRLGNLVESIVNASEMSFDFKQQASALYQNKKAPEIKGGLSRWNHVENDQQIFYFQIGDSNECELLVLLPEIINPLL